MVGYGGAERVYQPHVKNEREESLQAGVTLFFHLYHNVSSNIFPKDIAFISNTLRRPEAPTYSHFNSAEYRQIVPLSEY